MTSRKGNADCVNTLVTHNASGVGSSILKENPENDGVLDEMKHEYTKGSRLGAEGKSWRHTSEVNVK